MVYAIERSRSTSFGPSFVSSLAALRLQASFAGGLAVKKLSTKFAQAKTSAGELNQRFHITERVQQAPSFLTTKGKQAASFLAQQASSRSQQAADLAVHGYHVAKPVVVKTSLAALQRAKNVGVASFKTAQAAAHRASVYTKAQAPVIARRASQVFAGGLAAAMVLPHAVNAQELVSGSSPLPPAPITQTQSLENPVSVQELVDESLPPDFTDPDGTESPIPPTKEPPIVGQALKGDAIIQQVIDAESLRLNNLPNPLIQIPVPYGGGAADLDGTTPAGGSSGRFGTHSDIVPGVSITATQLQDHLQDLVNQGVITPRIKEAALKRLEGAQAISPGQVKHLLTGLIQSAQSLASQSGQNLSSVLSDNLVTGSVDGSLWFARTAERLQAAQQTPTGQSQITSASQLDRVSQIPVPLFNNGAVVPGGQGAAYTGYVGTQPSNGSTQSPPPVVFPGVPLNQQRTANPADLGNVGVLNWGQPIPRVTPTAPQRPSVLPGEGLDIAAIYSNPGGQLRLLSNDGLISSKTMLAIWYRSFDTVNFKTSQQYHREVAQLFKQAALVAESRGLEPTRQNVARIVDDFVEAQLKAGTGFIFTGTRSRWQPGVNFSNIYSAMQAERASRVREYGGLTEEQLRQFSGSF